MKHCFALILILIIAEIRAQSSIEEIRIDIIVNDFDFIKDTIIPAKQFRKFAGLIPGTKNDSLSFDGWENMSVLSYNMIRYHNSKESKVFVPKNTSSGNKAIELASWTYPKNMIVFEDIVIERR
jgi:hypothetical protein